MARRAQGDSSKRYDWSGVDWAMQDTEIARILGCSVVAPWKARRRLGKGPSPWHHLPTTPPRARPCLVKARRMRLDIPSLTARQIAERLGIEVGLAHACFPGRRRVHIEHDWSGVTPEMLRLYDDKYIARLVGCSAYHARNKRIAMGIKRPKGGMWVRTAENEIWARQPGDPATGNHRMTPWQWRRKEEATQCAST